MFHHTGYYFKTMKISFLLHILQSVFHYNKYLKKSVYWTLPTKDTFLRKYIIANKLCYS